MLALKFIHISNRRPWQEGVFRIAGPSWESPVESHEMPVMGIIKVFFGVSIKLLSMYGISGVWKIDLRIKIWNDENRYQYVMVKRSNSMSAETR